MPFTIKSLSTKSVYLTEEKVQKITYQLLVAIKHIQHFNIPHLTFVPENILIDYDFNLKINGLCKGL